MNSDSQQSTGRVFGGGIWPFAVIFLSIGSFLASLRQSYPWLAVVEEFDALGF
jgi:hypothetical protein